MNEKKEQKEMIRHVFSRIPFYVSWRIRNGNVGLRLLIHNYLISKADRSCFTGDCSETIVCC